MPMETYKEWFRHATRNYDEITKSKKCICFNCGKIFDPSDITDYIQELPIEGQSNYTATCPFCGIDTIVGDASGLDFSQWKIVFWEAFGLGERHED